MDANDFDEYVRGLGFTVEIVQGANNAPYTVVRDVTIKRGSLAGKLCDVAIARTGQVPYVPPSAIFTRPHLLPMNTEPPLATQSGNGHIGPDWQYWSRRFDHPPSPKALWAHIITVLGEM